MPQTFKPSSPGQSAALWRKPVVWVPLAVVCAAGLYLLYDFDPSAPGSIYPRCPSLWLTGTFCLGCGITRALHALLHGDVAQAMAYNGVALLLGPVVLGVWAFRPQCLLRPGAAHLALGVLILYWVLRNIPFAPFVYLAPHVI